MTKRKKRDPLATMKDYEYAAIEIATHSPLLANLFRQCIRDLKRARERKPERDPLAALKKKHRPPWKAIKTILRPKPFDTPIIYVADANGKQVIPWGGFDQMDKLNKKEKLALARAIAKLGAK